MPVKDILGGNEAGLPVAWVDGFVLWPNGLGLDTVSPTGFTFISHAHVSPPAGRILATEATFRLLSRRVPKADRTITPFERPFKIGQLEITLFPAGHILGSAQLLVEVDGRRILYASGVQTGHPVTAERLRLPMADLVVLADHCLPPTRGLSLPHAAEQAAAWAMETASAGFVPVFLVHPVGPAQDLLKVLAAKGLKPRAHRSIYDIATKYERYGIDFEGARRLDARAEGWDAVLLPRDLEPSRISYILKKLGRARVALVTGLADDEPPPLAEETLLMSTHTDRAGLVRYVLATGAKQVALSPIYPAAFARSLAKKGLAVFHFRQPRQLSLSLERPGKK